MEPDHLREDLRNEVVLVLLEKPDELICGLEDRGELKWYVVRIILNLVKSNSSPFTKRYRQSTTDVIPEQQTKELNGRLYRELQEDRVREFITTLHWYERTIMEMYGRLGSYRAIEKETRIPWESCYSTVRKVITRIRKEVLDVAE